MMTNRKQTGFTLLEILIAIAIFALISFATFMLFQQSLSTDKQYKKHAESLVALQRCYRLLQSDLSQIIERTIRDEYGEKLPTIQLIDTIDGKSIEFTRAGRSNPFHKPRSNLLRLQYFMRDKQLIRKYWTHLDRSLDTKQSEQIILNNIKTMSWQFLDANEWISLWPSNSENTLNNLPKAVQVTITAENNRSFKWLFPITISSNLNHETNKS